jgi:hypothetical protein
MDPASLFTTIALLILLAVTPPRFGVERRQALPSDEQDRAFRGVN